MVINKSLSAELGYLPKGRYFCIAVIGGKDTTNLGNILRLAVNFNANAVFLIDSKYRRSVTDTFHTAHQLPIIETDNLPAIPEITQVWIDFHKQAVPLMEFKHPKRALYIFGGENKTLDPPEGSKIVFVPTIGCLNISMAVGIVLYDRMLQFAGKKNSLTI